MFWCRPRLTSKLRQAFNDIAETLKQKIEEGVQYFQDNDYNGRSLHYVEISQGFDTHRFCETNHTFEDQWDDNPNSENVWLYNPPKPFWVPQMPMQRDVDKWLSEHPENDVGVGGPPDRPGSWVNLHQKLLKAKVTNNMFQSNETIPSKNKRL